MAGPEDEAAYEPNDGPAATQRAQDRARWGSNREPGSQCGQQTNKTAGIIAGALVYAA